MATLRLSYDEVLRGIAAFLDDATALQKKWQEQDEKLVKAALAEHEEQLQAQAMEVAQSIAAVSSTLLPVLDEGKAPPPECIEALNASLKSCLPSQMIPAALAEAKPKDRVFKGLVQKLQKVCCLDAAAAKAKLLAQTEESLRSGDKDCKLSAARNGLKSELDEDLWQNSLKHAQVLAQSDHQPIYHAVQLPSGASLKLMSWNVLEFPSCEEGSRHAPPEAVRDGIKPSCDALLQILGRKGKEEHGLLLQAMSAHHVISMHFELIVQEIKHALTEKQVKVVLLQEVSTSMQAHLTKESQAHGWHVHFSQANSDLKKCDAITCVISLDAFEETADFECLEGNKPRFFAAVRMASLWFVSCHVPGEVLTKEQKNAGVPSHGNAVKATTTFGQLLERFLADEKNGASALVAGGDFNTDVRILKRNVVEKAWCSHLDLQAPDAATCLDVEWPIDAFLVASRKSSGGYQQAST